MTKPSFGFIDGYALLIGVGNYRDKQLSLSGTVNDAQELCDILTDPDRGRYSFERVTTLVNHKPGINRASKARIFNGFRWLEERATLDSTVIIYFSGHGMRKTFSDAIQSGTAETYYLLPGDCSLANLENTAISIEELASALGLIAARNMLLIFDCCHADSFKPKVTNSLSPNLSAEAANPNAVYSKIYSQLRVSKGLAMIFSSKVGQSSWLMRDKQSSVFTHYLLGALRGEASELYDTEVTVSRIFGYVSKKVPATVQTLYGADQIPQIVWEGEEFAVARIPKTTPFTFQNHFDTVDRVILVPISELSHENFNLGDSHAANFHYITSPIQDAYDTAIQTLQNISSGREAAKRGILVIGGTNSGKTRLAFEALIKVLPEWLLLQWSSEYSMSAIPARASLNGRDVIIFIDDLQKYVSTTQTSGTDSLLLDGVAQMLREIVYQSRKEFNARMSPPQYSEGKREIETLRALLKRVREAARRMVVVATCRIEDERHVRAGIGELFDELRVIKLRHFNSDPRSSEAEQIIQAFKKEGAEHVEDWDGTLGSLVLGLSRKQRLYDKLVVRDDPAAVILRSMKLLAQAGIVKQTKRRIQSVCTEVFGENKLKERRVWQIAVELLTRLQFLREETDASIKETLLIIHKDTYFEKVVTDDLQPRFTQLQDILVKLGDTAALASLGHVQFNMERYQESLATFDQALVLNPLHTASWYGKLGALSKLGQREEALTFIDDALVLDPNDANLLALKGSMLINIGRNEEALTNFDHALALNLNNHLVYFAKARILEDLKRYEEALVAIDNALALISDDLESLDIWYHKALTLIELERFEEAFAAIDHALTLQPDHRGVWGLKVGELMNLGRYREALEALNEIMAFEPDHAFIWYFKGEAYLKLEHYEEALAAFDQALTIDSEDTNAWNGEGMALFGLERYEEALVAFEHVDSKALRALAFRGITLVCLERYEEALPFLDQALAVDPMHENLWMRKGEANFELERYEEALFAFKRVLALTHDQSVVWFEIGRALLKLERYKESLEAFGYILDLDPTHTEAWSRKGLVLIYMEHYEEALTALDHTLVLNPDYTDVWTIKGNLLMKLERYEEALSAFKKALVLEPEHTRAWCGREMALIELGRYEEALSVLDNTLNPKYVLTWSELIGDQKEHEKILTFLDYAVVSKPTQIYTWVFKGVTLYELRRMEEGLAAFHQAQSLASEDDFETLFFVNLMTHASKDNE